jgi:ribosome-binding ATPase YchF (GTP1/OBG family)
VTSSNRLYKERSQLKKALESGHSHNLLVVVCENDTTTDTDEFYQKLVKKMQNKRVIIISQGRAEVEDELRFVDLNEKSKRFLIEKEIEFQGSLQSVADLIIRSDTTLDDLIKHGSAGDIIHSNSIEELLMKKENISIRTCRSARFEPLLYVERQLEFSVDNNFYDQIADSMECTPDKLMKD